MNEHGPPGVDPKLLQSFIDSLAALERLVPHVANNVTSVARVEERLADVKEDIVRLSKVIYDGSNGQKSMLQSMTILETTVNNLAGEMLTHHRDDDSRFVRMDANHAAAMTAVGTRIGIIEENYGEDKRNRATNQTTMRVCIIGTVTSLLIALFELLKSLK